MLTVTLLTQSPDLVKIAIPGLSYVGIDAALGDVHVERFATVLGATPGLKVTTRRDIEQILGLERQKQLLGCSEDSASCLAELRKRRRPLLPGQPRLRARFQSPATSSGRTGHAPLGLSP